MYEETEAYLKAMGLTVPRETYRRYEGVLKGINEQVEGPDKIFKGVFGEKFQGAIIEPNIPITSFCEHHILPWFGECHIGYIATSSKVLGLSKFTRLVRFCSVGLTLQERVANDIADNMTQFVSPDCMVVIDAFHTCKAVRGARNLISKTRVIEARGLYRQHSGPRIEFFNSIPAVNRQGG